MTQESLNRFLLKFVDTHLGIWIYEPKTSEETWTTGLETVLGIDFRAGRSLRQIFPELDQQIEEIIRNRQTEATSLPTLHLTLHNPVRFFSCDLKLHNAENGPLEILSAEIRKLPFSNAVGNKTLYNILKIFAQSPGTVVFMTDEQGHYTYLDGSGLESLGIIPEEWLGRSIFEFLKDHPEHTRMIKQIFQRKIFSDQSRFGNSYFEDRLFPIIGPDDEIIGVAGIQVNVTDKVTAQNDLHVSNLLLDNLFDSIPENAYLLDREFNVVRANAAAQRMFSNLSLVGTPCFKTIHGQSKPCDFCPVVESFETGQPAVREHFDEKMRCFFEMTSFPIRDRQTGEIIGAVEMASDITDRKRMEESLLRNQALLDDLLEILDEGVYLIDSNYTITRANKAMCDMYPDLNPLIGKKCYDTTLYGGVCPNCAAECMFREGKATTRTFFEKNSEDEPGIWLELTAFPLYEFGSDSVNGAICILRDVTPRIEMESQLNEYRQQIQEMAEKQMNELRLSEAKLRLILETSGAAISFADYQGRYTYINGKYKDMFGYSQEDLLGKPITFTLGQKREETEQLVKNALKGGNDSFRDIYELTTKDGRTLWADTSVSIIRGRQPNETQLISVILDVTAQQELFEQLNKAKIAAEDASREKSQFLATMSHEIRTPLNGVIGISNLLMDTPLLAKQLEYARLIKASGESLLFLINDVLDFSKIEAGKFELVETEFIIQELVESVVGILASKADEKNLDLIATFDNRVPGPIIGDPGRLRQVLLNLAGNALKFTEEGGVRIHVSLDALQEKGIRLRFDVFDTGIGIPEDRQDRLFQRFSQVDSSSTRAYGGTGLGLAISKRLIELMDGDIHVESIVNRGSTFWFTASFRCAALILKCMKADEYPCITEKRDYCKGIPPERCARSGREVAYLQHIVELKGSKTLLVGTGRVKIPALIDQLNLWKMPVVTAATPDEALRLLKGSAETSPFRLIIVDFAPQDREAERFVRIIQDDKKLCKTRIVALASLSEDLYQRSWRYPDLIRCVTKPVSCSILLDSIVQLFFDLSSKATFRETSQKTTTHNIGPIRVLVAEDNRINQIVITEILQNSGMTVTLAVNGEEAFEKSQSGSFDVIVMDCQMPVMDGYDATRNIRKREKESGSKPLPIIALTANATSEDEAKCLAAGMDAYCSKPVSANELIGKIEQYISKTLSTDHRV